MDMIHIYLHVVSLQPSIVIRLKDWIGAWANSVWDSIDKQIGLDCDVAIYIDLQIMVCGCFNNHVNAQYLLDSLNVLE